MLLLFLMLLLLLMLLLFLMLLLLLQGFGLSRPPHARLTHLATTSAFVILGEIFHGLSSLTIFGLLNSELL